MATKNFKNFQQCVILKPAEIKEILLHRQETGKPFMVLRDFANGKKLVFFSSGDVVNKEMMQLAIKTRTLKIMLIADQVEYLKTASELLMKNGDVDFVLIQFGTEDICLLPEKLWTYKITECHGCERYLLRKGITKKARKDHMNQHLIDYYNIGKVADAVKDAGIEPQVIVNE